MSKLKFFTIAFVAVGIAAGLWFTYGNSEKNDEQIAETNSRLGLEQESTERVLVDPAPDEELPDESSVTISLQSLIGTKSVVQRSPPKPPDQPIVELLPSLVDKANSGDGDAAYYLYRALTFCMNAPTTEEQYQERNLRLLTTRKVKDVVVVDDTENAGRLLANKFRLCAGMHSRTLPEADTYLEIAANSSNIDAQVAYGNYLLEEIDPKAPPDEIESAVNRAVSYIQEAKTNGSADAYFWSGFYGLNGSIDTGGRESALSDLIVAHVMYAGTGSRRNIETRIEEELDLLYPQQRQAVLDAASTQIASENCCSFENGQSWDVQLSN